MPSNLWVKYTPHTRAHAIPLSYTHSHTHSLSFCPLPHKHMRARIPKHCQRKLKASHRQMSKQQRTALNLGRAPRQLLLSQRSRSLSCLKKWKGGKRKSPAPTKLLPRVRFCIFPFTDNSGMALRRKGEVVVSPKLGRVSQTRAGHGGSPGHRSKS